MLTISPGLKEQTTDPNTLQFNIALAIFYVPYICVDVPSNWVLKYFKAGRYLPFLITAWGIVSTCTGFVKNYGDLLAVRFFLGLSEGGLLGGMILYLSMFYRRHQLLYRIGKGNVSRQSAALTKVHSRSLLLCCTIGRSLWRSTCCRTRTDLDTKLQALAIHLLHRRRRHGCSRDHLVLFHAAHTRRSSLSE